MSAGCCFFERSTYAVPLARTDSWLHNQGQQVDCVRMAWSAAARVVLR
jgi:hypothetical protein